MCFEKASQIYDLLVLDVNETEESSAIQAHQKAQLIQDDSFTRRIMNCLVYPDHVVDVQNAGRHDSIEAEWRIFMTSLRTRMTTGFNPLRFSKLEGEKFPRLSQVARVVFAFAATSTSCERSFSLARHKIGRWRQRISLLTLQRLVFSAHNRLTLENVSIPEELPVTIRLQGSDIPFNTEEPEDPLLSIFSRALGGP
jgi:hypothetical protein